MRWKAAAAAALAAVESGGSRVMVIRVPIAGCVNSKRCGGLAGGVARQAERSVRAASRGEIRSPKAEVRKKAEGPKSEGAKAAPNIQHPTSNIQHPNGPNRAVTGQRRFGVGWEEFPGFIGIGASAQVWGQQRAGGKSEVRRPK